MSRISFISTFESKWTARISSDYSDDFFYSNSDTFQQSRWLFLMIWTPLTSIFAVAESGVVAITYRTRPSKRICLFLTNLDSKFFFIKIKKKGAMSFN